MNGVKNPTGLPSLAPASISLSTNMLIRWLAVAALLGAITLGAAAPRNIVLVLIDDMGAADGSCFGSTFYRTPELERLAKSGMRFTQAYASCAVCSPTRAAIMTGKTPARLHLTDWIPGEGTPGQSRFRVPDWQQSLPREEVTLAEALKELGYATASIGKWHLGGANSSPRHQGFDLNIAGGPIGHPASYFWPYGNLGATHRVPGLEEAGGTSGEYLTDRLTSEALQFIETNSTRPFFLYLAHYAVHSPLMAKEEMIQAAARNTPGKGQSNAVYSAMLKSVDESVGRILNKLEELRIADQTIVVFTSDNGGAVHFGKPAATSNPPWRLGKGYPYEGGLRVPLLVRAPGVTRPASTCDVPVVSHDFFPTLLELAGGRIPKKIVDGISFVPLLRGESPRSARELFWHYPHYWNGTAVTPYSVVRSGDWKLIRLYEFDREELYNLRQDPGEEHDLAALESQKLRRLSGTLDNWLKEVEAQMPVPRQ
jgi:arylsulfatase A